MVLSKIHCLLKQLWNIRKRHLLPFSWVIGRRPCCGRVKSQSTGFAIESLIHLLVEELVLHSKGRVNLWRFERSDFRLVQDLQKASSQLSVVVFLILIALE